MFYNTFNYIMTIISQARSFGYTFGFQVGRNRMDSPSPPTTTPRVTSSGRAGERGRDERGREIVELLPRIEDEDPILWISILHSTNRVLTVLLEKLVQFTLVPVNSYAGESKTSGHLAIHPFGQVPVLQDGGFTLFESRAIIRYLCERFPSQGTRGLYGFTGADKALVEQWLEVESQVLQPALRPLVKQLLGLKVQNTQNDGVGVDEKIIVEQTLKLAKVLDVYEVQLSKHKYLAGEFVSIADLSHLPMTYYYFCLAKQSQLLTARPHVAAWFHAISTRPSWCTVLEHAAPFFTIWAATSGTVST